jgi:hypothetical protein
LKNFFSLSAILCALHSTEIAELIATQKELPYSTRRLLKELRDYEAPQSHPEYKKALLSRNPCTPSLGKAPVECKPQYYANSFSVGHLGTSLKLVYGQLKSTQIDSNGQHLINFQSCTAFYKKTQEFLEFQAPSVKDEPAALQYLCNQLNRMAIISDKEISLLGAKRKEEEKLIHSNQGRRLQVIGF